MIFTYSKSIILRNELTKLVNVVSDLKIRTSSQDKTKEFTGCKFINEVSSIFCQGNVYGRLIFFPLKRIKICSKNLTFSQSNIQMGIQILLNMLLSARKRVTTK